MPAQTAETAMGHQSIKLALPVGFDGNNPVMPLEFTANPGIT